jgi:3-oxoacyl-[acyl-carrier protein] reductase
VRKDFLFDLLQQNVDGGTDPAYWWDEERTPLHTIDQRLTDILDLTGKKAVVTGGAGVNLGQACVNRLAGLGADVAVVDMPSDKQAEWVKKFGRVPQLDAEGVAAKFSKQWGTNCIGVYGDVMTWDGVSAVLAECNERLGGIDILVNSAFDVAMCAFKDATQEDIDKTVKGIYTTPVYCTRLVLDYMIPRGWGRIINVGSESANGVMPGHALYGPLKAALTSFNKYVGKEVELLGVKVLGVNPGCMWGPDRPLLGDSVLGQYALGRTAIQRFELPEEVANMIGFLCSEAASAMSGTTIDMGGGMTL